MRKITEQAVNAFKARSSFKSGNTEVLHKAMTKDGKSPQGDHFMVMELHGNEIARMDVGTGVIEVNNQGWETNTTKERLNGLGANIHQSNFKWFINDKPMPSKKWVAIK